MVGQVAGGAEKRRGKARETAIGKPTPPVHKVTAPVVAMGLPAAVAAMASGLGLDLSGGLGVICQGGTLTAAGLGFLMGVLALLSHLLGHGLQDATKRRT